MGTRRVARMIGLGAAVVLPLLVAGCSNSDSLYTPGIGGVTGGASSAAAATATGTSTGSTPGTNAGTGAGTGTGTGGGTGAGSGAGSGGGSGSGTGTGSGAGSGTGTGTGTGGGGPKPPTPTATPTTTVFVDALAGSDTNSGAASLPLRTITAALQVAAPGQSVRVAFGTYDAALGEVFPLAIPTGVTLVGDHGPQGAHPTIAGHGPAGMLLGYPAFAAVVGGHKASLAEFVIRAGSTADRVFCVLARDVAFTIRHLECREAWGGISFQGTRTSTVTDTMFYASEVGVHCLTYSQTVAFGVDTCTFFSGRIGIDNYIGNAQITNNTITQPSSIGVRVLRGNPLVVGNVIVSHSTGFLTAALDIGFTARPVLRHNTVSNPTGPCVIVRAQAEPDFGTAVDLGGNDFTYDVSQGGVGISHEGVGNVWAIGNTWSASVPLCGTDVLTTGGGTVIWDVGGQGFCR